MIIQGYQLVAELGYGVIRVAKVEQNSVIDLSETQENSINQNYVFQEAHNTAIQHFPSQNCIIIPIYTTTQSILSSFSPMKNLNIEDFSLLSVLGQGSYAKVLLVRKKDQPDSIYAMKIVKKKHLQNTNKEVHAQAERNILVECNHPFIIHMNYSFQSADKLYFILEYCPGGELYRLLETRRRLTEDMTRFYAAQIVLALQYLHAKNIIYRDLKPENVLIDQKGYIRITDFGLSKQRVLENDAMSVCGTPEYLAPEIITKQGHGKPVDWWCLGSIIYQMSVGMPPFYSQGQNKNQLFQKIRYKDPPFPNFLSPKLISLIKGLLAKQSDERLGWNGAEDVKNHPWFEKVGWNDLLAKQVKPPFIPILKNEQDTSNFAAEFTQMDVNSFGDGEECKLYTDFSFEKDKEFHLQMETEEEEETGEFVLKIDNQQFD